MSNITAMIRPAHPLSAFAMAVFLAIWPGAPSAHPHIFIDAGLHLVMEGDRVVSVEVTWLYDELFTLILLEERNLDPDFDLVLTEQEVGQIIGFDLDWDEQFTGGLELFRGGRPLTIGPPEPVSFELVAAGQFRTVHRRPVTDPGGDGPLTASAYDPTFYAAMEMTGTMEVTGAECESELFRADLDAAYAGLEAALAEIGGGVDEEDNYPEVGILFADRVIFTCAG